MQSDSENPAGRTETEHVPATCNQRHAIPIRLPASTRVWQRDSVVVLGICLLALIARVHRLMSFTAVIENEGPHYVRLAMNLLHGKGYLGMAGVPDLSFAPSYPLLIAATTAFAPNPELAARIVSVAFGCLMVVSMYFLALQVFRRETALVCATLTALHPVLVAYSTSVYNETTYLAILAASMAAALPPMRCSTAATTPMRFSTSTSASDRARSRQPYKGLPQCRRPDWWRSVRQFHNFRR